jgi:hypothetical protein
MINKGDTVRHLRFWLLDFKNQDFKI